MSTPSRTARFAEAWENAASPGPRPLLRALASGYRGALGVREWLYACRLLRSRRLGCPVVSVGNLTVGGTGKTPAVELAVRTLAELGYRPAVVSRGYRRQTSGVQIVADTASIRLEPEDAGDEPFLLARRLPGVPVVVGANRFEAARLAVERFGVTAVALDDGFQHRTLEKDLEILMARARNPWGNGRLLPGGPLREPVSALARADLVVATGAETLEDAREVTESVQRHAPGVPVVAARYAPVECWEAERMRPVALGQLDGLRLVAFAGIASPAGFRGTLRGLGVNVESLTAFADHHWYDEREVAALEAEAERAGVDGLVTTEKDWVRLRTRRPFRRPLYVVSIKLDLLSGHEAWTAVFARACPKR